MLCLFQEEQDKLRRLRLEQEFDRRVQEANSQDDNDRDSDPEMTSTSAVSKIVGRCTYTVTACNSSIIRC
jgi:hypothetical protein